MAGTDLLAQEAAKISKLMNAEVEWTSGIWSFRKKRAVKLENSKSGFCCSLNMEVSFYGIQEGESAVNMAEVFLVSEEVPVFTSALKQQALLFPTNYLQQVRAMEHGLCCLQLESLEPVEHFVGRLFEGLLVLEQQIPVIALQEILDLPDNSAVMHYWHSRKGAGACV
ncbi:hypothetical protein [Planococcus sp. ISL-109]|uniref:hypothetical protein n=1 Tax=Planococcus sp. ISL-109 TaxID=2819166 RepID=UPI001BED3429|nr:hypothetical protein [Planococcus sp. ISL-109]MBT2583110.1 hypothetical protein [Planococcus sp. ISL-109]